MIPEHAETLRRKREAGEKNTSLAFRCQTNFAGIFCQGNQE